MEKSIEIHPEKPYKKPTVAYYMLEKNGGYEVYQSTIEDDIVLDTKRLSDPDAWDQSILTLEAALSKQFQ